MPFIQLFFIILTFTLPLALAWGGKRWRHPAYEWAVRRILAFALIAVEIFDHIAKIFDGTFTFQHALPLQLCDWALFVTVAALLFRSQRAFELAYFWGLAGTIQALFTPAVGSDLPLWRLAGFFGSHSGIVIGVLYLILAEGCRPKPRSLIRVFLWCQLYLAAALLANHAFDANYGFLSKKPSTHTLLDFLSDEPRLYVLQLEGLAILFFLILYTPWWVVDLVRNRRPAP